MLRWRPAAVSLLSLLWSGAPLAQALVVDGSNSPYEVNAPASFERVTVADGGVLVANAPLTVTGDLSVEGGGLITIDAGVTHVLELEVSGRLTVAVNGAIDVSRKGCPGNTSIDPTSSAVVPMSCAGCGGTHFASGGRVSGSVVFPSFDEPANPRLPGGGGGRTAGGGVVLVTAGTVHVDGRIAADGEASTVSVYPSSGAGGSVNLTAAALTGSGVLAARGGPTLDASFVGAGGLIFVRAETSLFRGAISVEAGSSRGASGSAGLLRGDELVVAAGDFPLRTGERYGRVTLRPGARATVTGRPEVGAPLAVPAGASLVLADARALDLLTLAPSVEGELRVDADLRSSTPLLVRGTLVLNRRLDVTSFDTEAGARVTHDPGVFTMHLVAAGGLRLAAGAQVNVSGKGLPGGRTIHPLTLLETAGSTGQGGGSHAGRGGSGRAGDTVAPAFDDPSAPRFGGGGGGGSSDASGGGLVRLTAALVEVDGVVLADGLEGVLAGTDGAGAGGSIVVMAGTLTGAGSLLARGDQPIRPSSGGGGGGGIVHLETGSSTFRGTISVVGGPGSTGDGGDGVVFERTVELAPVVTSVPPNLAAVGVPLRYLARAGGTSPLTWSLVAGPLDARLDPATGALEWVPTAEGAMPFEVAVANAFGAGSQRFTVLAAAPPVITSAAARVGATCVRYRYDADETPDVAGSAPLAWSLRVGPQGMSLDPKTGRVRWVPTHPGQFSACLEVVNAVGAAEECFEVSVPGDGDAGEESGECGPHEPLTVGCGCASASTGASFALLLAGVGWLLERRRRGRQVHADGGG